MIISINDVRKFLGMSSSDKEFDVYCVDSLGKLRDNTLMFINKPGLNLSEFDESCNNCVFLINESYQDILSDTNEFIRISNPKYYFTLIVDKFSLTSRLQEDFKFSDRYFESKRVHGDNIYCEEFIIGRDCHFDRGVIIGGTDFSPVIGDTPDVLVQFPQLGGVMIGDRVVIKYNSMVGKGTFGYTQIGDNTMIDYGCQIGHNCIIGNSCIIAAGTIIGGSTILGNNVVVGIGAKIRNGLKIGNNVSIGMGAVVIRDIPDNTVVVGNPAKVIQHKPIFDQGGLV